VLVERLTRDVLAFRVVTSRSPITTRATSALRGTHDEPRELLERFGAEVKEPVRIATTPSAAAPAAGFCRGARGGKRISQERFEQLQATAPARW